MQGTGKTGIVNDTGATPATNVVVYIVPVALPFVSTSPTRATAIFRREISMTRNSYRVTGAAILVGVALFVPSPVETARKFSEWAIPANLGPLVNSAFADFAPQISSDGLSLYFTSTRPDSFGGENLWVSQRTGSADPWGPPVNLGSTINTDSNERSPALSGNGHLLFFATDRLGGVGAFDIWISWRADTHDDFAWEPPVNLGTGINTPATDAGPSFFENNGQTNRTRRRRGAEIPQLYMASNRPGGLGNLDIYVGAVPGGWFGPPVLVAELSSPQIDLTPSIRRDGLEIVIASGRAGTVGGQDLWVSTRQAVHDVWSVPVNLGPVVNSVFTENFPSLSFDGETLFFNSNRPDGFGESDLYVSSRTERDDDDNDDGR